MARIYDVVCLNCGETYEWCKYDPPFEKCDFCGCRLSDGDWWNENARVFGVWSSSGDVYEAAKTARTRFFEERPGGYRFRLPNGVWCTIKPKEIAEFWFWFSFKVRGESIWLLFKAPNLADKVELLKKRGTVPTEDLCMVLYRKQSYSPSHPAAQSIVKAVEANEKPELVAAACL
jgi:hypothetical protein